MHLAFLLLYLYCAAEGTVLSRKLPKLCLVQQRSRAALALEIQAHIFQVTLIFYCPWIPPLDGRPSFQRQPQNFLLVIVQRSFLEIASVFSASTQSSWLISFPALAWARLESRSQCFSLPGTVLTAANGFVFSPRGTPAFFVNSIGLQTTGSWSVNFYFLFSFILDGPGFEMSLLCHEIQCLSHGA